MAALLVLLHLTLLPSVPVIWDQPAAPLISSDYSFKLSHVLTLAPLPSGVGGAPGPGLFLPPWSLSLRVHRLWSTWSRTTFSGGNQPCPCRDTCPWSWSLGPGRPEQQH